MECSGSGALFSRAQSLGQFAFTKQRFGVEGFQHNVEHVARHVFKTSHQQLCLFVILGYFLELLGFAVSQLAMQVVPVANTLGAGYSYDCEDRDDCFRLTVCCDRYGNLVG